MIIHSFTLSFVAFFYIKMTLITRVEVSLTLIPRTQTNPQMLKDYRILPKKKGIRAIMIVTFNNLLLPIGCENFTSKSLTYDCDFF